MESERPLEAQVLQALTERGATVAIAETTVGGLISARLISVPGSSRAYVAGIIPYRGSAKTRVLGVPEEVARTHGSVSTAMAEAMAQRVRALFETDYGLAETGMAGPRPPSSERPSGLVHMAVVGPNGLQLSEEHRFDGDRGAVQAQIAEAALALLLRAVTE